MPRVSRLVEVMEAIAPTRLAEPWDNVGLLAGDPDASVDGPVVLTIDLTEAVAAEALGAGAGAVVAYHPPIFSAVKRMVAGPGGAGRMLVPLLRAGVAVYAPHTALDAATGGVNDWLLEVSAGGADALAERRALAAHGAIDPEQSHKVIVFVPHADAGGVRDAMAAAGAGRIGAYERCSFGLEGRGTFFGTDETNPAVGQSGRLEEVEELRVEMVCGEAALGGVVAALVEAHPYEEPAFDVYKLEPRPDRRVGAGRLGTLRAPETPRAIAARVREVLGVRSVRLAEAGDGAASASIGVCPGAGGSLAGAVPAGGVFVTGEMRHHDVLAAVGRGVSVVLAGHTNTERGYLPGLAERIGAMEPAFEPIVSAADRWPFEEV